jgi:hypothetical protein
VTGSLTMPPGRSEDGALTTLTELSLILVYLCVLVIKTCDVSSEACSLFGFGDAKGAVQLFLGCVCEGKLCFVQAVHAGHTLTAVSSPSRCLYPVADDVTYRVQACSSSLSFLASRCSCCSSSSKLHF